ncbi:MAG: sigma-70 family RNA polymerase sigma factor [Chloroflexota bacterium]|nr:sigma-70 family RNA polymerase sigma factor [Chloroflexota bacterium]MDE2853814.1 sigma-70 family RNA polymerase sigma factor [Chloroflexota bacterium]MDE2946562.1 sigma-70 family RNA polymerase sigma factor [Chloroflexota bacterium]
MPEVDLVIIEWVTRAKSGDQDAFAELVYLFQDPVYNLCYRMLGESGEAEDATQETFLRVFRNLERYDTTRPFKTWLLSIASNHCIDRLRKRRMQFVSLDDDPTAAALALRSNDPTPEQAALTSEVSSYVQSLLLQLDEHYRLAVVYRYWYQYSYAEIADMMDTTESAIKSRLHRARKKLAELLETVDELDVKSDDRLADPMTKGS